MTHVLDRIADRSAKVVVLGQGYVGLVVADHAAFDLDEVLRTAPRVLDTRNRITGEHPNLERL